MFVEPLKVKWRFIVRSKPKNDELIKGGCGTACEWQ